MTKNSHRSRLDKLEREIIPETRQPSYICITDDEWDRLQAGEIDPVDLGIVGPTKVYIGIDLDWDNPEGDPSPVVY